MVFIQNQPKSNVLIEGLRNPEREMSRFIQTKFREYNFVILTVAFIILNYLKKVLLDFNIYLMIQTT